MGRCRKRRNSSDEESKKENQVDKVTALRNAGTANARERARMQVLSKAFVKLKTTLPWVPADTKLSKLDTLRLATSYIAHLRQILAEDDAATASAESAEECNSSAEERSPPPGSAASIHPINFTWPYSFHGKITAQPDDPVQRSPDSTHPTHTQHLHQDPQRLPKHIPTCHT